VTADRDTVVIAGEDLPRLLALAAGLQPSFRVIWTIESVDPVAQLERLDEKPAAVVLLLSEHENVADIRELASYLPETAFVFLSPSWPPRAPLARVASESGTILNANDNALVISAAIVSMLAQGSAA
jgi:hypothetical protein